MKQTRAMFHPHDVFHDVFHDAGLETWWFESYWFSFFEPERRLMVYIYPWFRPSLGICGGGVIAWDHRAAESWNIPHCDYSWHLPCPAPAALLEGNTVQLPQGVRIDILEPLRVFRLRYQHPALQIDVVFRATQDANISTRAVGSAELYAGRLDQCGRIDGEIVLHGERIAIACLSMRDRSWGVRKDDNHAMHIGYFHATASAQRAFLAVSDPSKSTDPDCAPMVSGYLMLDGLSSPLVAGEARLQRLPDGTPFACEIDARDERGRSLSARGRAINRFAYQPFPGMFNWSSLANWSFNSENCVGELQETWHPDLWRAFRRARRAAEYVGE